MEFNYNIYNDKILSGKIKSSKAIYLAAERFERFKKRVDIYFDEDDVNQKINFIAKLKHSVGKFAGKPFMLLPWQQWIIANIFGFKWKKGNHRVCQNVFLMLSRKSGKSSLAAAIALCELLCETDSAKKTLSGQEIEIVANSRQQAKICLDMTKSYALSIDPQQKLFKHRLTEIRVPALSSKIQVLSSDAMSNDGYNSSCFILDEFHAAKNWDLYNVMKSSQGMRENPLSIIITTAGFLLDGYPCFEHRKSCIEILNGEKEDDTQFSAIYELDEDDDIFDEENWLKCCPSLGETVTKNYLRNQVHSFKINPLLETSVRTKNFNQFVSSKECWIPKHYVDCSMTSQKDDLSFLKQETCWCGVDLSAVSDLTCYALMFPPNGDRPEKYRDKFIFLNRIFVPTATMKESINAQLYQNWVDHKYVYETDGNVVDYDAILNYMVEDSREYFITSVAYDTWNATQWAINAQSKGFNLEPYGQSIANFNRPTKAYTRLLYSGKVLIDWNQCVRWSFNNVEIYSDHNENQKPVKSNGNPNKKIDPIIAMLEALGQYLNSYGTHPDFDFL